MKKGRETCPFFFNFSYDIYAAVVELVATPDLGSGALCA